MYTLYHCNNSYASQKVRLFLAELDVPYQAVHIDLLKQKQLSEAYLAINPQGLVPALVTEHRTIIGSTEIMLEAAQAHLGFNTTNPNYNHIYNSCKADEDLHDPHMRTLSYQLLWMTKTKSPEETARIIQLAEQHPNKARGEFLKRAVRKKLSTQESEQAKVAIAQAIEEMEHLLSNNSDFIFGKSYSMADAVATARIYRLLRLGLNDLLDCAPNCLRYYQKMKSKPSFCKAILNP